MCKLKSSLNVQVAKRFDALIATVKNTEVLWTRGAARKWKKWKLPKKIDAAKDKMQTQELCMRRETPTRIRSKISVVPSGYGPCLGPKICVGAGFSDKKSHTKSAWGSCWV